MAFRLTLRYLRPLPILNVHSNAMYEERRRRTTNKLFETDQFRYTNDSSCVTSAAVKKSGHFPTPLTRFYMVCLAHQAKLGRKLYALEHPFIEYQESTKRVDDESCTWLHGNQGVIYQFGDSQLTLSNGRWYINNEWNRLQMKRYLAIQKLMKNTQKAVDILQIFDILVTIGIRPLGLSGFNMIRRCTENIIDILTIVDILLTIYSNTYNWFLW